VVIVDEQPRVRSSLKALLTAMRWSTAHPDQPAGVGWLPIEVVGEAESAHQAVGMVGTLQPDVVVMDVHPHALPAPEAAVDGLATIQTIRRQWPAIRIVVLTMYATDRASVLAAGADVFLLKGCPTGDLLDAMMPTRPTRSD
jgi:DNA-binding NarL/FixJ family response regulator